MSNLMLTFLNLRIPTGKTCNIKENQIQLGLICEKTRNQAYFSVAVAIEKTKVTIQ